MKSVVDHRKVSAEWLREEHPLEYEKLKGEGLL